MKGLTKEDITKIIAGIMFGVLFLYVYFAYFWGPYSKKIAENKAKIEKIDKDIASALKAKAEIQDLEKKLEELKQQKAESEKRLPKEKKVPDLLQTIKKISDKYSVKIVSITPANSSKEQYFTKVNYSMVIKGNYHNIGKFFTAIALEERIFGIENVTISQSITENTSCSVSFTLSAYQFGG